MDVMRNNGNQVMKPAFIRFVNKTPYDVEIYCQIKSDDQERSFGCVAPNNYVDSNTYTTYQFVFRYVYIQMYLCLLCLNDYCLLFIGNWHQSTIW